MFVPACLDAPALLAVLLAALDLGRSGEHCVRHLIRMQLELGELVRIADVQLLEFQHVVHRRRQRGEDLRFESLRKTRRKD